MALLANEEQEEELPLVPAEEAT